MALITQAGGQGRATSVVYQPMSNLVQSFTAGNGLVNWNTYTSDYELDLLGVYFVFACCCRTARPR